MDAEFWEKCHILEVNLMLGDVSVNYELLRWQLNRFPEL